MRFNTRLRLKPSASKILSHGISEKPKQFARITRQTVRPHFTFTLLLVGGERDVRLRVFFSKNTAHVHWL